MSLLNSVFRVTWPFLAVLALTSIIVAGALSAITTIDQRDRLLAQADQVEELVRAQRAEAAEQATQDAVRRVEANARLSEALGEVERLINDHDTAVQQRLEDVVRRVAELLDRPAGVPVDPVTARPLGASAAEPAAPAPLERPAAPPSAAAPRPGPSAGGGTTSPPTTTTTPDQRSCARKPGGPRC